MAKHANSSKTTLVRSKMHVNLNNAKGARHERRKAAAIARKEKKNVGTTDR